MSCDLVTDLPFHRIADVHRLNDSTITMLLCPSKADLDNLPGVKPKKKGIYSVCGCVFSKNTFVGHFYNFLFLFVCSGQQRQREFIGMSSNDKQNHRVLFLANEADLEVGNYLLFLNMYFYSFYILII